MNGKKDMEKMWEEKPCQVPLELCQWRWYGILREVLVHQLWKDKADES